MWRVVWFGLLVLSCVWMAPAGGHAEGLQLSPKTDLKAAMKKLRPRRIALIVGVQRYKHDSWPDLKYPVNDARKIQRFLLQQGQFDEILMLVRPQQTTLRGIRQGLRWLLQRNRSVQDTIVIYVSGHGTIAQPRAGVSPERYLVTTDSTADVPKTGLALAEIKELMRKLLSRRKVVILATCYVGQIKRDKKSGIKGLHSGMKGTYSLGWVSRTALVLSAAGYMQPAYELDRLRGDVYTHFLLQCARQNIKSNKRVTATQAHKCATPRTYEFVRKYLGRNQTPSIESRIMGKDNLYLAGLPSTPQPSPTTTPRFGWLQLLRHKYRRIAIRPKGSKGGDTELSIPTQRSQGTVTLRLPAGSYTLRWLTPSGQPREETIMVAPDSTVYLTPDARLSTPLGPNSQPASNHRVSGYFEMGPDFQLDQRAFLNLRLGYATPYASIGVALGGTLSPTDANSLTTGEPLIRLGILGQFGYTLSSSHVDLFFNVYLEMGLWGTNEVWSQSEMVFFFAYGPNLRFRWWITPHVALRLSAALLFTVSPDQPQNAGDFFGRTLAWTHRPNFIVSLGFDFGAPLNAIQATTPQRVEDNLLSDDE